MIKVKLKTNKCVMLSMLFLLKSVCIFAQIEADSFVGKWITKDKSVMEIRRRGSYYELFQISAISEKEKKDNGKQFSKDIAKSSNREFRGILLDPSSKKEFNGTWIVSEDGKFLKMKVKWGFINFSETWIKH